MSSRTQIIATLGPVSGTEPVLSQLIEVGVDAVRLNFSFGTYDEHAAYISAVRSAAERAGKRIPIIQDLSGPRSSTEGGHTFDGSQDTITEKDLRDLDFGVAHGVAYIAQSYVGTARDVERMRAEIQKRSASMAIIAKIERQEAVAHIEEIIRAADAIMIARGDLGLEEPLGEIPFLERDIIARCRAAAKPSIVATHLLYSMVHSTEPTRAEVTDAVFAILSGADALLLADETARGDFPTEAVKALERIIVRAENDASAPAVKHLL